MEVAAREEADKVGAKACKRVSVEAIRRVGQRKDRGDLVDNVAKQRKGREDLVDSVAKQRSCCLKVCSALLKQHSICISMPASVF